MKAAFGKRWAGKTGTPFNFFRTRRLGNAMFVTVNLVNEHSDYESVNSGPRYDNYNGKGDNSVMNRTVHSCTLGRLQKQISGSSSLLMPGFIEKAKNLYGEAWTKAKGKEGGGQFTKMAKGKERVGQFTKKALAVSESASKPAPTPPTQDTPPSPSQDIPAATASNNQTAGNQTELAVPATATDNQTELAVPATATGNQDDI
jgi:hypothetical protein